MSQSSLTTRMAGRPGTSSTGRVDDDGYTHFRIGEVKLALRSDVRNVLDEFKDLYSPIDPDESDSPGDETNTIRYPAQTVIALVADASDNLTIDRVEFYQNGELLGIDREWPYGFEYDITSVGTEIFSAVVFDQVGNNAQSDLVVEIVRS